MQSRLPSRVRHSLAPEPDQDRKRLGRVEHLPVQHRHLLAAVQRDHDHPEQAVLCLQLGVVGPVVLGDVPLDFLRAGRGADELVNGGRPAGRGAR